MKFKISVGAARFNTASGSASAGGGNARFGWFADVDALPLRPLPRSRIVRQLPQRRQLAAGFPAPRRRLGGRHEQLAFYGKHRPHGSRRHEPPLAGGSRPESAGRLERLEPQPRLSERPRRRTGPRGTDLRARQPAHPLFVAVRYARASGPEPLARESGDQPCALEGGRDSTR